MQQEQNNNLKLDTQHFWDSNPCGTSESWERARQLRFRYTDPYLLPHFEGAVFDGREVLEVGCGQGLDASQIVRHCSRYVGLELSRQSLGICRTEVSQRESDSAETFFVKGDAERLCFPDASFDVVYSVGVLHHTPGFDAALNEVCRVLRPGGHAVLMLYRSYTPLWIVLRSIRAFLRAPLVGPALRRRLLESSRGKLRTAGVQSGTAIQELIGCPIINTYTKRRLVNRFFRDRLGILTSERHRVGCEQVIRILPPRLRRIWPQRLFERLEARLGKYLGFYLFLIAEKSKN